MQYYYDAVIIGGGIAGTQCEKQLSNSGIKVLLVEKNKKFFNKVCAGGITKSDEDYIPKKYFKYDYKKAIIKYNKKTIRTFKEVITTFDRPQYLKDLLTELSKSKNITIKLGVALDKIISKNTLILSDNNIVKYKYLIGADGALSKVRKFLNLKTKNYLLAIQYKVQQLFKDFVIELDNNLGLYTWIFPHKSFTLIGCGTFLNDPNIPNLKKISK